MSRRWIVITVAVTLIAIVGGVWAALANRGDAQVEEVKQLADRLFGDQRGQIPEKQRSALFDQLRHRAADRRLEAATTHKSAAGSRHHS